MAKVEVGKKAPDFTLPATDDEEITLSSFRGQTVVLYFYPRDNTPGCTQQGLDFTDKYKQFKKCDAVILGISRDTVKTHQKFKEKQGYVFPLLADPEEEVCQLYQVMKDKNMYGKKVRGIERSTFIIDKSGKLVQEWRKVKVPGHVDEVLEAVKAM